MAETTTGIYFDSLKYAAKFCFNHERKEILHEISGALPACKLTAIMGPSGSGKTTLLNILAGYVDSFQGTVTILPSNNKNTHNSNPELLPMVTDLSKPKIVYIPQEAHLCGLLTVQETFQMAAEFNLPNFEHHQSKILTMVKTLGLEKVLTTRVACISGGERKRVILGIELLGDFDVIFIDEPTTGLDIKSTQICIDYLKSLAVSGKTVVCTIHQPSATILDKFDYMYVLSNGYCLYQGPINCMLSVLDKFNLKCPHYHNPADFIVEIASGEYEKEICVKSKLIEQFNKPKVKLTHSKNVTSKINHQNGQVKYKATSTRQLTTLLRREYIKAIRNPTLTYLRLATSVLNSFVLCAIFWQIGNDVSTLWFNYNGILGFVLHLMMPSLMLTILTFPMECNILTRENMNRWYSLKWYYISITLIDLPICIIYCLVSNIIYYTLTAQPLEIWRFATFSTLGFMICIIAQSFGLLVGSIFNVVNGTFIGSAISFPMMLFAGFGMTFKDIPDYIRWIGHFSYLKYGVEGMAASVMGYNRQNMTCSNYSQCIYSSSQEFLDDMGVSSRDLQLDFVVLIGIFIVLRIVTYLCLKRRICYR